MEKIFDEEKVKIKFEGQTHQIDVKTLTSSLVVFSEALKEINTELKTGKGMDIKIEALSPGSFEVHAIVSAINNNDLLTAVVTSSAIVGITIGAITKTYTGIVKLRSWLKKEGDEISEVHEDSGDTIITTKNGNTHICSNVVYNTYVNNQVVNDAISDQFRILEEDSAIDGFTMSSGEESVSVTKDEFTLLAQKVEVLGENKRKEVKNLETVYIVKPVFENSLTRRWEFIWNGNRISANITDSNFLIKVEQGEYRFGTGDSMSVDIQISQTLNPIYNAWMNEAYQIILVHDLIPRPVKTTSKLF